MKRHATPAGTFVRLSALLLTACTASAPARASAVTVWTALASEKIRPSAAARSTASASLGAARNEYEAFQVIVTGPATNVRATAGALGGPGTIADIRLYRVATINLANASAPDGGTGAWPDALVPDVDEIVGEKRNAFPFDVGSESRAIWVDVHVPADAPAGDYAGTVSVTWDGGGATVPVALHVWPFALPSTPSLKSAFGLSYGGLLAGHGISSSGTAFPTLRAAYGALALDHRITLSHIDDGNAADLGHLATYYGAQFDGTADTGLAGAKMTAIQYMGGSSAYATWVGDARASGWFDRLFQYTCDEPPQTCAWSDIPTRAAAAHAADPAFRTLVTTSITEAGANGVTSSIDIMVPVINFLDDKPGLVHSGEQRQKYDAFLASGPTKEVWTYQSCMSHGCGGTSSYFTGWPTYMIDSNAVRSRALEWLSFRYRLTGELYYETTMAYSHDPWNNQWDFSGNGDGTLFYPGTPAKIGGTTHVPVASIRLKMIREGMEDFEYLKLLSDAGDPALASSIAQGLFPSAYDTDKSAADLMAARAQIAARIVELTGGTPAGGTGAGGGTGTGGSGSGSAVGTVGPGVVRAHGGCAAGGAAGLAALGGLVGALGLRGRRRG